MQRRCVLAGGALALCAFLACQLPAQTRATARQLVGTWSLVKADEVLRDGRRGPYPDLGPDAKGTLIYTADRHMCVMLMRPGRSLWHSEEEEATPAEKISAGSGFSAYCGIYRLDRPRHLVLHMPEVSYVPNLIGSMQARPFELKGNQLTFAGTESSGPVASWRIVWRRADAGKP
jgi:hypothetical protein